jgi:hypothetical protein
LLFPVPDTDIYKNCPTPTGELLQAVMEVSGVFTGIKLVRIEAGHPGATTATE